MFFSSGFLNLLLYGWSEPFFILILLFLIDFIRTKQKITGTVMVLLTSLILIRPESILYLSVFTYLIYKNFNLKQIKSLKKLLKNLIKKYKIKKQNILGHSDIAPNRKKDPGEKFPWLELSKINLCHWHGLNIKEIRNYRKIRLNSYQEKIFFRNLYKIGYAKFNKVKLVEAFQRRFRQGLVNGKSDQECLKISENLVSTRIF